MTCCAQFQSLPQTDEASVFVGAPLEVRTERSEATKGRSFFGYLSSQEIPDRPTVDSALRTVRPLEGNSYSGFAEKPSKLIAQYFSASRNNTFQVNGRPCSVRNVSYFFTMACQAFLPVRPEAPLTWSAPVALSRRAMALTES